MDENNDLRPELSEKQIRKQGAQQAGKEIAEVVAKGAATYFGGAVGGKAADLALKTKAGQKLLEKAGDRVTKSPAGMLLKNKNVQNAVHQAAPIANQLVGSLSGGAKGASASGASNASANVNAASSSTSSGSGIGEAIGSMTGGKKNKGSFKSLPSGNSTAQAELNDETPGEFSAGADVLRVIKRIFTPMLVGLIPGGCGGIMVILIVAAVVMSPIMYVNDVIEKTQVFGEKLKNFLLGEGWSTDEEAAEKAIEDFYDEVDRVYNKYSTILDVELDYDLIVATLTWYAPPSTEDMELSEAASTQMRYFKKSRQKVNTLAEWMVSCYLAFEVPNVDGEKETVKIPFKCGNFVNNTFQEFVGTLNDYTASLFIALADKTIDLAETGWQAAYSLFTKAELDLEKYRGYLEGTIEGTYEDDFIRKFYYNNEDTERIDKMIPIVADDIFTRAAYFKYLNGSNTTNKKVYANCDNGVAVNNNGKLENVSLDEYVAGVVCPGGNCNGMSEDEIKVQAIAVRTQVLSQTSNCTSEVVNNSFSANTDENILNIIKQTNNQIIISNDKIYDIDSIDKEKIKELLDKGLTYEEIIKELYGDENATLSGMIVVNGQYVSNETAAMNVTELRAKADYYASLGEVELAGEFINLANLYSSGSGLISQCPWYAKSRALELIYSSDMPDDEKLKAYEAISNSMGNGTDWYDDIPALNNFEKSSNINEPRVGAIISWSSDASKAGHSYGHVAIIEQVDYANGTVTISESYNAGGVNAPNNWENVGYRMKTFTFEELESYGNYKNGGYSFNGYVYILG